MCHDIVESKLRHTSAVLRTDNREVDESIVESKPRGSLDNLAMIGKQPQLGESPKHSKMGNSLEAAKEQLKHMCLACMRVITWQGWCVRRQLK